MSGYAEILKLECAIVGVCPLYISSPVGSILFALTFFPLFITLGLYTVSLYKNEFYLFCVSIMMTIDWLLNIFLQHIIATPSRFPGCGPEFGMPSFATQHIILFDTIFFTFLLLYKPTKNIELGAMLVKIFTIVILFGWTYIGINTKTEMIVGALIGFIEGIVFQYFIYHTVGPYLHKVLKLKPMQILGIDDTICRKIIEDDFRNYDPNMPMFTIVNSNNFVQY